MTFEILKSKLWDAYDKNCWFYERVKLSYFTFKNGQENLFRSDVNLCVQVFLHLAIGEKFRG